MSYDYQWSSIVQVRVVRYHILTKIILLVNDGKMKFFILYRLKYVIIKRLRFLELETINVVKTKYVELLQKYDHTI